MVEGIVIIVTIIIVVIVVIIVIVAIAIIVIIVIIVGWIVWSLHVGSYVHTLAHSPVQSWTVRSPVALERQKQVITRDPRLLKFQVQKLMFSRRGVFRDR